MKIQVEDDLLHNTFSHRGSFILVKHKNRGIRAFVCRPLYLRRQRAYVYLSTPMLIMALGRDII